MPERPARGRRFDPGAVVTGLLFLAAGAVFLRSGLTGRPVVEMLVFGPVVVAGLGLAGIVHVLTRRRRR
ncbi:hypothetical protein [Actinomadura parmotrematis]|uniref:DUF3098 domain-containing protein n=1 Tax=Actinomadura parmotrematis TaxID=2864039 RepID=A0ABS7G531_9ACTN|nr:hypothetical protein [Actinomadura parmotrematis]MBW8486969.1 hypothetical protein [Actinomadura parmotrematis]